MGMFYAVGFVFGWFVMTLYIQSVSQIRGVNGTADPISAEKSGLDFGSPESSD